MAAGLAQTLGWRLDAFHVDFGDVPAKLAILGLFLLEGQADGNRTWRRAGDNRIGRGGFLFNLDLHRTIFKFNWDRRFREI